MVVYDPADDADKMRALIQLAASLAAKLADVATSLRTEAEMLGRDDADHYLPASSTLIKRSAKQIELVLSNLLAFAGRLPSQPRLVSLVEFLTDLTPMLERMVGPTVALKMEHAPAVPLIRADCRHIERIICTLVARARDAVVDRGSIAIRVVSTVSGPQNDRRYHVRFEISDDGRPIEPLDHIFEPVLARKSYGYWLCTGWLLKWRGKYLLSPASWARSLRSYCRRSRPRDRSSG